MRKERKNGHPDSDAENVRFIIPYDLVCNVLLPLDGTASVFPKDIEEKARLHQPPFPAAPDTTASATTGKSSSRVF